MKCCAYCPVCTTDNTFVAASTSAALYALTLISPPGCLFLRPRASPVICPDVDIPQFPCPEATTLLTLNRSGILNSTLLLQSSAWLLVITAAGGLVMAFPRFRGRGSNPPAWLAMLHGFLAAAGLTLLAFAALTVGIPGIALAGLALLLVAAGGGRYEPWLSAQRFAAAQVAGGSPCRSRRGGVCDGLAGGLWNTAIAAH